MTLADIIARLEAAEGPDREIDVAIIQAVFPGIGECTPHCPGDEPIFWHDPFRKLPCPRLTESVDAAIALAEKVLPGCDICTQDIHADFRQEGEPRHMAEIMTDLRWVTYDAAPEPNYEVSGAGQSNSRAIALCIATLQALRALQAKTGDRT